MHFFVRIVSVLAVAGAIMLALAWRYAFGPLVAEWESQRCQCAVNDFTLEHYPAETK